MDISKWVSGVGLGPSDPFHFSLKNIFGHPQSFIGIPF